MAPHTARAPLTTNAIHETDIATPVFPSCTCHPCTILTRCTIATSAKMIAEIAMNAFALSVLLYPNQSPLQNSSLRLVHLLTRPLINLLVTRPIAKSTLATVYLPGPSKTNAPYRGYGPDAARLLACSRDAHT